MPDITLCTNSDCPMCDECGRYCANPSPYFQDYTRFEPEYNDDLTSVECDHFKPCLNFNDDE